MNQKLSLIFAFVVFLLMVSTNVNANTPVTTQFNFKYAHSTALARLSASFGLNGFGVSIQRKADQASLERKS